MVVRLGFLASGKGTGVESIVKKIQSGKLDDFKVEVILCNKPRGKAGVYEKADRLRVRIEHTEKTLDQLEILKGLDVDLVLGMGYLKKIGDGILEYFGNRIWNIHPALLPRYSGKGMYGLTVHKAVIEAGDRETGATIHIMNPVYDDGQILNQVRIPVIPNETPEMLQKRVLQFEYTLMATTLELYRDNLLPNCPRENQTF